MKHVYKNWLVKATIGFAAITSIRLLSTVLHMTTLEKLYKPRDFRKTSHLSLDSRIISSLPTYCQNMLGQKMEPINLIFIGAEANILKTFKEAGWHTADPSTPIHWILSMVSSVFNRTYHKGPFMPLFISIGLQDLSFQQNGHGKKRGQRHHIRLWRTRHETQGKRVWVAAATHEIGMKTTLNPPFIVHKMNPDLDYERDYILAALVEVGAKAAGSHRVNVMVPAIAPRINPHGDKYYTDGRASVIEIV